MANPISNLGTVPTLTVGGYVFVDIVNLIHLFGYTSGANTEQWATLREPNGTAGYTPSGAFDFSLEAGIFSFSSNSGTFTNPNYGYAATDAGFASAGAPTTPIYAYGSSTAFLCGVNNGEVLDGRTFPFVSNFIVPNGQFPLYHKIDSPAGNNSVMFAYGYEV